MEAGNVATGSRFNIAGKPRFGQILISWVADGARLFMYLRVALKN